MITVTNDKLNLNTIENTDCLKGLEKLPAQSIDFVVTSPPYFNVKDYSTWNTYDDFLDFLEKVFTETFRVLKDGRMCAVNISNVLVPRENRQSESTRIPLSFHFVVLMEKIGFKFLEDIVWSKPEGASKNRNGGFYRHRQPVAYKPNIVTEYIFVFQKPAPYLIDKIVRGYDKDIKEKSLVADGYERSNIWHINPKTKSEHPAPYPLEIPSKLISYYSYEQDVILDMFMGSGTSAVASKTLNRYYIGFELHNKYIGIANSRLDDVNYNNNTT